MSEQAPPAEVRSELDDRGGDWAQLAPEAVGLLVLVPAAVAAPGMAAPLPWPSPPSSPPPSSSP